MQKSYLEAARELPVAGEYDVIVAGSGPAGVSAAIMNSDCLVFDTAIAHLFADNGNLGINVTISTCCP